MAVGIACGVYSFVNAVVGTLTFCLVAFFLRLTPFSRKNSLRGQLRLELPHESGGREQIEKVLRTFTRKFVLKKYRVLQPTELGDFVEYTYDLSLHDIQKSVELARGIRALEGAKSVRLGFDDTYY